MNKYVLLTIFFLLIPIGYASMSCSIQTSDTCSTGIKVLGLENETGGYNNAHAQIYNFTGTLYANSICCEPDFGVAQNSCASGDVFATLDSEDNAHVQAANETGYSVDACISNTVSDVTCLTTTGACDSGSACVMSISDYDNAHAGACDFYSINICCSVDADPATTFSTIWKTDNLGTSNDTQITLPLEESGNYSFSVDWGDGNTDTITSWNQSEVTHNYASAGTYTVNMTGTLEGWRFNNVGDVQKILDVQQWGSVILGNSNGYFYGATNLNVSANDTPNLSGTTNFENAFRSTDLSTANNFNDWDMSGAISIESFFDNSNFNSPLSNWDVSQVTNFAEVFWDATSFNQNISSWNTSSASSMTRMFAGATSFNQPVNSWDVSGVYNFRGVFGSATNFNQPLSDWNTSSATNMMRMFSGASSFNQDISSWVVSGVEDFYATFANADSFNQDISSWNVNSALNMYQMFGGATSFDQNLGTWNITSVTDGVDDGIREMFDAVSLSRPNYDSLLIGWENLSGLQSNMNFSGGNSQYTVSAISARESLTGTYNWTITDGGLFINPPTLLTPTNNNLTLFDRDPEFTWSGDTGSGVYHQINITAPPDCSAPPLTNVTPQTYTSTQELCVDKSYEWTVRTCYESTCSAWATPYNFTIASVLSIELISNQTSFGELSSSTESNTISVQTPDNATSMTVNNTGNIRINTTALAINELWQNQPLATEYFQFADQSTTNWVNFTNTSQLHTNNLLYATTRDIEIRVQVPVSEPPGSKSSTIQIAGEPAE